MKISLRTLLGSMGAATLLSCPLALAAPGFMNMNGPYGNSQFEPLQQLACSAKISPADYRIGGCHIDASNNYTAFRMDDRRVVVDMPRPMAGDQTSGRSINVRGHVAGNIIRGGRSIGFAWDNDVTELHPSTPSHQTYAYAINGYDLVYGCEGNLSDRRPLTAVVWPGFIYNLNPPEVLAGFSRYPKACVFSANDYFATVGSMWDSEGRQSHAFFRDIGGMVTMVEPPSSSSSHGIAVNQSDGLLGSGSLCMIAGRARQGNDERTYIYCGANPGPGYVFLEDRCNAAGLHCPRGTTIEIGGMSGYLVVGAYSTPGNEARPFVYDSRTRIFREVSSSLPSKVRTPGGITGVDLHGFMVGYGRHRATGRDGWFVKGTPD